MTAGMNAPTPTPSTFDEATAVLAAAIPNYEARPEQARLARSIESAIESGMALVGQGGCGVGKSFASLVPAILSGQRVVYSTATKALQEQIAAKDLPFLAQHFPTSYAILKGRSNYLCLARLAEMDDASTETAMRDALTDPACTGERDDLPEVDNATWAKLTISSDECPGRKTCPFGSVCYAEQAKERAKAAQVVVVNHALLANDAKVRAVTDGNASMLDEYDVLIVDEAHELEDYVSSALATTFRQTSISTFATEVRNFARTVTVDADDAVVALNAAAVDLFDWLPVGRLRQAMIVDNSERFEAVVAAYQGALDVLNADAVTDAISNLGRAEGDKARVTRDRLRRRAKNAIDVFTAALLNPDADTVRYVEETFRPGGAIIKSLIVTPVTVSAWLEENLWAYVPPILISATILIEGKADFIANRLGVSEYHSVDAGSPFDYTRQALLYVPKHLPEPSGASAGSWSVQAIEEMHRLVRASDGRALLLFTSRKEMNAAWDSLAERLPYPCKRQGDESNQALMAWFKADTHSVLFALKSFFTGIDIQGDALGLVVINKLPFPVPTEPVFEARAEAIKRRGGNDFGELTIPTMTLPLQQAFGRLIRTRTDAGVVAILDPRLSTKGYGRSILRSLPNAPVVHDLQAVERFYAAG